jgi:hypothetical protein
LEFLNVDTGEWEEIPAITDLAADVESGGAVRWIVRSSLFPHPFRLPFIFAQVLKQMTFRSKQILIRFHCSLRPGNPTHNQWLQTIELLSHKIPPGQLRLTIDPSFSQEAIYYCNGGEYQHVLPHVYVKEAENTWGFTQMLVKDLAGSGVRLKDFFLHFTWPVEPSEDGLDKDRGRILEKRVIGSGYEGAERGKFERRQEWNGYITEAIFVRE